MAIYVITTGEYSDTIIQGVVESDLTKEQVLCMGDQWKAIVQAASRRAETADCHTTEILKADGYRAIPKDMDYDTEGYFLDWLQKTCPIKIVPWEEVSFGTFYHTR